MIEPVHQLPVRDKISVLGQFHAAFSEPVREIHLRHATQINSQPALEELFAFIYNKLTSPETELLVYRLADEGVPVGQIIRETLKRTFT